MTHCDKIQEQLPLLILGDLAGPEAQDLKVHLEKCELCSQEYQELKAMMGDLRDPPPYDPGDLFFRRQLRSIQKQLPGASSDLEEEYQDIILQLKALDPPQVPSEEFFQRQFQEIQQQLPPRVSPLRRRLQTFIRPLAVAAALVFLVLGISRIDNLKGPTPSQYWQMAFEYLSQDEDRSMTGVFELEDLSQKQLEQLAGNLEGYLLMEFGENLIEESSEWEDLNGQELEILIQRLKGQA